MRPDFIHFDARQTHPYDGNPNWQQDGACRGQDVNLWFPRRGESTAKITEAKTICNGCPIRQKCLDYALWHHEHHGIWGGLTELERRTLRRETGIRPGPTIRKVITRAEPIPTDRCGTSIGYQRHYRAGEQPCEPCRQARNAETLRNVRKARAAARQRKQSLLSDEQP